MQNVMLITYIIVGILYCGMLSAAGKILIGKRTERDVRQVLILAIYVLFVCIAGYGNKGLLTMLGIQLLITVMYICNYEAVFRKVIRKWFMYIVCILVVDVYVIFCVEGIYMTYDLSVMIIVAEFITLMLYHLILNSMQQKNSMVLAGTVLLLIVSIVVYYCNKDNVLCTDIVKLAFIPIVSALLTAVYKDIIGNIEVKINRQYGKELNDSYNEQVQYIIEMNTKVRSIKHDMENHIKAITAMLKAERYNEALDYIESIDDSINGVKKYIDTGNFELDAVINQKIDMAKKQQIDVDCNMKLPRNLDIAPMDVVVIVGNLFDNAIKGVLDVYDDTRKIKFDMIYSKNVLMLDISNNCGDTVKVENNQIPQTNKKDKEFHGIGLRNVKRTVEKYNGEMQIDVKDKIFMVKISLYI